MSGEKAVRGHRSRRKKAPKEERAFSGPHTDVLHAPSTASPMSRQDKTPGRTPSRYPPQGGLESFQDLQAPTAAASTVAEYDAYLREYSRRLIAFQRATGVNAACITDDVLRDLTTYQRNRPLPQTRREEIADALTTPGSLFYELQQLRRFEAQNRRFITDSRYVGLRWMNTVASFSDLDRLAARVDRKVDEDKQSDDTN